MAGPRVLTPDVVAVIVARVSEGNSVQRAAGLAGVSQQAVCRWLAEGQRHMRREAEGAALTEPERAAADIARQILRAQADWSAKLLGKVSTHALTADDGVSSAKWLLERQFPDDFGRRVQVEAVVLRELEKILDVARDALSPESYGALLAALARAGFGDAEVAGAGSRYAEDDE